MIIAVRPYPQGYVELEPIDYEIRELVRVTNQYDNTCIAYLETSQDIEVFLGTIPEELADEVRQGYAIEIDMDGWVFRHMVGGQCD